MKKVLNLLAIIILCILIVGCSNQATEDANKKTDSTEEIPEESKKDNEDDQEDDPEPVYHLSFKTKEYTIGIGEEIVIELETDVPNIKNVKYKNSDNTIVAFQKNGNLKALKAGTVTVTAKYGEISDTMTITVTEELKVFEKTDYRYWTKLISATTSVEDAIMEKTDIDKFNEAVYSDYSKTRVYDLSKLSLTVTKTYVTDMINSYSNMNSYTVYKSKGVTATTTEKNAILADRNLNAIPTNVIASYGIIVNFARMRSYPTNYYASTADFDYFMETGLDVGEAVIIYHTNVDGSWSFVQAENYYGWIETINVAKCTKDEFNTYYRNTKYMVVIAERTTVDGTVLRMGDKLPYKDLSEDGFVVCLPKKCNDETLCITDVLVPNDEKVNDGFLKYNYSNLLCQGFKLLNTAYRWGDLAIDGRDCSSTMNSIYHCFGFVMPRNTSKQKAIPGYSTVVNGLNDNSMKNYQIGTMIFTKSHVMMYIGPDENGVCYLLHNSGYCKLQTLADYSAHVSNPMIGTLTMAKK